MIYLHWSGARSDPGRIQRDSSGRLPSLVPVHAQDNRIGSTCHGRKRWPLQRETQPCRSWSIQMVHRSSDLLRWRWPIAALPAGRFTADERFSTGRSRP